MTISRSKSKLHPLGTSVPNHLIQLHQADADTSTAAGSSSSQLPSLPPDRCLSTAASKRIFSRGTMMTRTSTMSFEEFDAAAATATQLQEQPPKAPRVQVLPPHAPAPPPPPPPPPPPDEEDWVLQRELQIAAAKRGHSPSTKDSASGSWLMNRTQPPSRRRRGLLKPLDYDAVPPTKHDLLRMLVHANDSCVGHFPARSVVTKKVRAVPVHTTQPTSPHADVEPEESHHTLLPAAFRPLPPAHVLHGNPEGEIAMLPGVGCRDLPPRLFPLHRQFVTVRELKPTVGLPSQPPPPPHTQQDMFKRRQVLMQDLEELLRIPAASHRQEKNTCTI